MVKTKNLIFGVLWALLFEFAFLVIATVFLTVVMTKNGSDPAAVTKLVTDVIKNNVNLLSIVPFYLAMYLTVKSKLPGTKTPNWNTVEEMVENLGFKSGSGLVLQLIIIIMFTQMVVSSVLESINSTAYIDAIYTRVAVSGVAYFFALVYFSRMFKINLIREIKSKVQVFPGVPVLLILFISEVVIASELGNLGLKFIPFKLMDMSNVLKIMEGGIGSIILAVVIAPLFEEFFFRRLLLKNMLRKYSPFVAILIVSILFSCIHLDVQGFFALLFVGMLLGYVYYYTNDLRYCIVLHGLHNLFAYVMHNRLVNIPIPGFSTSLTAPSQVEFQPLWLDIIAMVAVAVIFVLAHIWKKKSESENRHSAVDLGVGR